jgi:hypothetical protein
MREEEARARESGLESGCGLRRGHSQQAVRVNDFFAGKLC